MSTKKDYTFSVETIRAGQPRPYADSVYEYIVKSELHEGIVRAFCTCVLRLKRQRKEDWKCIDFGKTWRSICWLCRIRYDRTDQKSLCQS